MTCRLLLREGVGLMKQIGEWYSYGTVREEVVRLRSPGQVEGLHALVVERWSAVEHPHAKLGPSVDVILERNENCAAKFTEVQSCQRERERDDHKQIHVLVHDGRIHEHKVAAERHQQMIVVEGHDSLRNVLDEEGRPLVDVVIEQRGVGHDWRIGPLEEKSANHTITIVQHHVRPYGFLRQALASLPHELELRGT